MKKYTYKNIITGKKIHSNELLHDEDLVLVTEIRTKPLKKFYKKTL